MVEKEKRDIFDKLKEPKDFKNTIKELPFGAELSGQQDKKSESPLSAITQKVTGDKGNTNDKNKEVKKSPLDTFSSIIKGGGSKFCPKCNASYPSSVTMCPNCNIPLKTRHVLLAPVSILSFLASVYFFFNSIILTVFPFPAALPAIYVLIILIGIYIGYKIMSMSILSGGILIVFMVGGMFIMSTFVGSFTGISTSTPISIPFLGSIPISFSGVSCFFQKLMGGQFQDLNTCYTNNATDGTIIPKSTTGSKNYNTLSIEFGNERIDENGGVTYDIPTIFASCTNSPETYSLPFYIKNSNSADSGEKVDVGVESVKAFMNESIDFYFLAQSIVPSEITINPQDSEKFYAENFNSCSDIGGGGVICQNTNGAFPCEERRLNELRFDVTLKYLQNVTHKSTLTVVRSQDDEALLSKDDDLRKQVYDIRTPSDGPADLFVTFTTPYVLGDRPDYRVRMNVFIQNKGSGVFNFFDDQDVIITPIGGLPPWIYIDPSSTRCTKDSGGNIIISTSKYTTVDLTNDMSYQFICDFKIDKNNYPKESPYQIINFEGMLEYKYKITNGFIQGVDRTFCINSDTGQPTCSYP